LAGWPEQLERLLVQPELGPEPQQLGQLEEQAQEQQEQLPQERLGQRPPECQDRLGARGS
jgi:hypothetical protein